MELEPVIAVMADVIGSRTHDHAGAILDDLVIRLNHAYTGRLAASFVRTQGDEIQGLLVPGASPLTALLIGTLESRLPDPTKAKPLMLRWAICYGEVQRGSGPSDRRNGPALWAAREALERIEAEAQRRGGSNSLVRVTTGNHRQDERLGCLLPSLMEWLNDLTLVQRVVVASLVLENLDLGPTELQRRAGERGIKVSTQAISYFMRSRYARAMLNGAFPVIRDDLEGGAND